MIIDVFSHFVPRAYASYLERLPAGRAAVPRWHRIPTLVDLDARLAMLDRFDGLVQIPSLPNPPLEALGTPEEARDAARAANDAMAELCARRADRFPSFVASVSLSDVDGAIEEADRAVRQLGAAGVLLYTNVLGAPLSDRRFAPIFDKAAALDRPIWLHPIRGPEHADYAAESRSEHEVWFTFGWPYETAAAMARLVFAGLFDRLPRIKIITHHLGGLVPYLAGKISIGFRQAAEGTLSRNPIAEEAALHRAPLDYFRMFYADTAVNGVRGAFDCGVDFFGVERCLFASDAPFDPEGGAHLLRANLAMLDAASLEPADRRRILHGNAAALLGLDALT